MRRFWKWGLPAFLLALPAALIILLYPWLVAQRCPRWYWQYWPWPQSSVQVTFMGVSTLVFDDGKDAIMIDGFFSRPALGLNANAPINSDTGRIESGLTTAKIKLASGPVQKDQHDLRAVVVNHTHFDHALNSATVAQMTGAHIVGSSSLAKLVDSFNAIHTDNPIPANHVRTLGADGGRVCYGDFQITLVKSGHVPLGTLAGQFSPQGDITEPPALPAPPSAYKLGSIYSVLIRHLRQTFLVQGSAGHFKDASDPSSNPLQNHRAQVAYLAVGGLFGQNQTYKDEYWDRVVGTVQADRVYPIHWDNFVSGSEATSALAPTESFVEHAQCAIDELKARAQGTAMKVLTPKVGIRVDPFVNSPEPAATCSN